MKHYSEIIKTAINKNIEKCDSDTINHKKTEIMSSITYTLNNQESCNTRLPMLQSAKPAIIIQEELERINGNINQVLITLIKVLSKVIRFTAFLIRIIGTSALNF